MKDALVSIMKTSIDENETNYKLLFIFCDRFIIVTELIHWIVPNQLKVNEERLSVENYEYKMGYKIPESLKEHYRVDHPYLINMLLSKSSTRNKKSGSFSCCTQCNRALKNKKSKISTKFLIANGFAIGSLTNTINDPSDLFYLMIAPRRPFSYIIYFEGGSHKKLKGVVTFFENDPSQIGSVLQDFSNTSQNPNVYCILCRRMTS